MKTFLALLLLIPSLSWGITLNEIFNFILHTDIEEIGKMILWIIAFFIGGYFALKLIESFFEFVQNFFEKREGKKEEKAKEDWEPDREKRLKAINREMFIFKLKGIIYGTLGVIIVILFFYFFIFYAYFQT